MSKSGLLGESLASLRKRKSHGRPAARLALDLGGAAVQIHDRFHEREAGIVGTLVLPDGRRVSIEDDAITIGRLSECDVMIDDANVSRHHAEISQSMGALAKSGSAK